MNPQSSWSSTRILHRLLLLLLLLDMALVPQGGPPSAPPAGAPLLSPTEPYLPPSPTPPGSPNTMLKNKKKSYSVVVAINGTLSINKVMTTDSDSSFTLILSGWLHFIKYTHDMLDPKTFKMLKNNPLQTYTEAQTFDQALKCPPSPHPPSRKTKLCQSKATQYFLVKRQS